MHVKKRNGSLENVSFDKVLRRIEKLCNLIPKLDMTFVDAAKVSMKVIEGIYSGVTTCKLDNIATEKCAMMSTVHPDYGILAARVFVSNLHKETESEFSSIVERLHKNIHPVNGKLMPLVNDEFYADVMANKNAINEAIDHMRDYELTYFGLRTLKKAYLLRMTGVDSKENIVERPQHLFMRVSVALHGRDIKIIETYDAMSRKYFIHATPTLFNAGTMRAGLSSCFLLTATSEDDSIENIYKLLGEMAVISKYSGGIGISLHDIRAKGSLIMSTNGKSEGLFPLMGVFNKSAKYVTQSNKRPGSIAVYLEPWHAEIFVFLKLRENNGAEDLRARDLFYGLWIPDLFMEKARKDEEWCLFCPNEAPGLADIFGKEFEELYNRYESQGLYRRKDAVNRKTNQKHVGTIRSSNLCTEIVQYTSHEESAVCNLASLCLPTYVQTVPGGNSIFDFQTLYKMVKIVTRNLDRVIDITHYPVEKARYSNMRHRPIGIGISGLADTFSLMKMPFDSIEAKELNKHIFETIYFSAAEASMEMARENKGKFQWDLWSEESGVSIEHSGIWDWEKLRMNMIAHGMRNSLLTAPMPTASTSQIMGVSECFEVRNSNIYKRQTLSGEFQMNNNMKQMIIENKGSVQGIPGIQKLYETSWEVSQKVVIQLSADRGPYVDQSQSLNIFMEDPTYKKLMSMHFYGYDRKLKTGMYYLKMKSATAPLQFSSLPQRSEIQTNQQANLIVV
ncbi:alpha subunit of ribonucleoside-diphosphate reductase [Blyttiomyces helicus]|uniref:Ribonucleoside-diphosphate reductase n=1 Tax=Blyttiomyces helicus TaxID=388810 RepID=A0A4P9WQ32_9FUNG|nr:alpha subunit of ribonucleoside-diphosphate reductase [Blyttiomyces helicus]|eukprot:RKO93888.1 alpha subunit of ribonucleoside-diphosphate reductase [Blyttiomyces helicus]